MNKVFDNKSNALLELDGKIGLVVTEDETGSPHISFLSSIQGISPDKMAFGQFCSGLSKQFITVRPDVAFLGLSADYKLVRGLARYTHTEKSGEIYDMYNNKPLFRYNSYMGFYSIYMLDLVGVSDIEKLNMAAIVLSAIVSRIVAPFKSSSEKGALTYAGKKLFKGLANLKFVSWCEDGVARITPIVGATAAGSDRIYFPSFPYKKELAAIPKNAKVAVFCMDLSMRSVLVKGVYAGKGAVDIERVYNSAPPKIGYIYPNTDKNTPVTEF